MDLILKLNVFATVAMFGVIWIVQLVHYPMLAGLEEKRFTEWHTFHSTRITFIVAPLMITELLSSVALVCLRPDFIYIALCALTLGVWGATFFVSVPRHKALGDGVEDRSKLLRELVLTNWIRTLFYVLKTAVLAGALTMAIEKITLS